MNQPSIVNESTVGVCGVNDADALLVIVEVEEWVTVLVGVAEIVLEGVATTV